MEDNGIDYEKVLADLKSRRERLDSAIAGIEDMLGIGVPIQASDNGNRPEPEGKTEETARPTSRQVASDSFFQMSASEAAKKYLRMTKRPASTTEICDALTRGGYLTNAKNFYSNVYTTLQRTPEFVKVKKDWGLVEWYPGRRLEQKTEAKEE